MGTYGYEFSYAHVDEATQRTQLSAQNIAYLVDH